MHGGKREGAGRKRGFAAKNAEEARTYISQRVAEEIGPIVDVLIKRTVAGDMRAMTLLLDRAWGKPRQEVQLVQKSEESLVSSEKVKEIADQLNHLYREGLIT